MSEPLWDDERIGSELDKVAFWCGPGDPEMVAVYDAKVIMRRMRDEYEAMLAATWQPVADGELVQDVLSAAGEGIACHRFALPGVGQLTQLKMYWVDEGGEWQDYFVALPSAYWLCRQEE